MKLGMKLDGKIAKETKKPMKKLMTPAQENQKNTSREALKEHYNAFDVQR